MKTVVLIPAYNEADSISNTIEALMEQTMSSLKVVVIANGCTDQTAAIARRFPIIVMELPKLEHKKSQALNTAWQLHARDADLVVCLDADTVLPSHAVEDWASEFTRSSGLGGSSSKFTMLGEDFLTRLQRAEFSKWTDTALRRGYTTVLAGTGCALSGEVLRRVAAREDRDGPWVYTSQVEDFELTYRIRELGYRCQVSPTVRAYTDSMTTVPALWGQRMKWQVGTVEDLLGLGFSRLTVIDWAQQASGLFMATMRLAWVSLMAVLAITGHLQARILWFAIVPLLFVFGELMAALRIPHRNKWDVIYAVVILPQEVFAWLRAAWFVAAWWEVLVAKMTKNRKDRWSMQYAAEGI